MNFLEDFEVGRTVEIGRYTFTAEEILRFARAFDPQLFHVDEAAARETHFGALCASGWHTAAVWMKLMVAHNARTAAEAVSAGRAVGAFGPSPGFDKLRWLKPVYAGDTITYRSTIEDKRPLASRPGWGLLVHRNEAENQKGEPVFSFIGKVFVERRT